MTVRNIGNNIIGAESGDSKPTNYATDSILYEFDTGAIYEWTGSNWVQRTPGLSIANEFSETITITKAAGETTNEILQEWKMEDDADSFIAIENFSTTNDEFIPNIHTLQTTSEDAEGFRIDTQISDTLDGGTLPILIININKDDNTPIATRPLFDLQNNSTSVLTVKSTQVDFNSNEISNATIVNSTIDALDNTITNVTPGELDDIGDVEITDIQSGDVPTWDGSQWVNAQPPGAAGGESNTASNIGTAGVGIFDGKVLVDLQFKKINSGSAKITVTDDTVEDEVDIDVDEGELDLANVGGTLLEAQLPSDALLNDSTHTVTNKTINASDNTVTNIGDSAIGTHTTTKITTIDKSLLNTEIVYNDQANTFGDFTQKFRSGKLELRDSDNSHSYILTGSDLAADRTVTFPLLAGPDTIVMQALAATLTNKTLVAADNTITGIVDTNIGTHTTSKITTIDKALLNTSIMYEDEDNNIGAHYLNIGEIAAPSQPSSNNARLYVDSTSNRLSIKKDDDSVKDLEIKQYPFTFTHYVTGTGVNANFRGSPGVPTVVHSGRTNASFVITERNIVITRVEVGVSVNTRIGTSTVSILDDDVAVSNTTLTINSATTGRISSGAISEAVAAGSELSIKLDLGSTGNITCQTEIHGYYNMT